MRLEGIKLMMKKVLLLIIFTIVSASAGIGASFDPVFKENIRSGNFEIVNKKASAKPKKTKSKRNLQKPKQKPHHKREKGTPIIF